MAIQRSNIATNSLISNGANGGGGGGGGSNRARDLSPISPRSANNTWSGSTAQFNPRLILSQIISLQSFHYLVLGVIFQINHVLFATSVTMDRIFTAKYLDVWSASGWIDNAAILMSSLIGSILLAIIVEKSKKCLDFSVTLFLIHIVTCSIYGGFPSTWDWWIIHTMGMILMVVLGEYLCSKKELSDIPLLQL